MEDRYTVIDLYCGGGGFSEGFRQAGFEVTHAIDIDGEARKTYEMNDPGDTRVIDADLSDFEPSDLTDDIDIVIGSPPCGEFSTSKRGGNGDASKGLELVDRFLYFVHELEPKYWVMENVPRLENHLEKCRGGNEGEIPDLDVGEEVHLQRRDRFDCSDFRTPQRRKRLFSGDFPNPIESHSPVLSLDEIRRAFPRPTERSGDQTYIVDPLYDDIEISTDRLSDHFYNTHLTERECKEIEVLKEDHSYYGPMSFPDVKEKASRTVISLNRRIARETLVLEEETPPSEGPSFSEYRKPTIRELATIQGFPVTYQFSGTSVAQKRRRVGDAVPPTMAYQIALGILEEEGHDIKDMMPSPSKVHPRLDYDLSDRRTTTRSRRKLTIARNFRHHVPYDDMRKFRVDLETTDTSPQHPLSSGAGQDLKHPVGFQVVFYRGYAKEVEKEVVPFDQALDFLREFEAANPKDQAKIRRLLRAITDELNPLVPDAMTLQGIRTRRVDRDDPLEYEILETIAAKNEDEKKIVDRHFPLKEYRDENFRVDILGGTDIPVRELMKLIAAHYVAHKLNYCGRWISRNPEEVFLPADFEISQEDIPKQVPCINRTPTQGCIEDLFIRIAERGWEMVEVQSQSAHSD